MTTPTDPILGFRLLAEGMTGTVSVLNERSVLEAALLDRTVLASQTAPPGSPAEGGRYRVTATATGAWAGQEGKIALYYGAAWSFIAPWEGLRIYDRGANALLQHDGSAWAAVPSFGGAGVAVADAAAATVAVADTAPSLTDSPVDADALRDELEADWLPVINDHAAQIDALAADAASLRTQLNALLASLRTPGTIAT